MSSEKILLSGFLRIGRFFLRKKLAVFFIFASLLINGFAPSAAEVSKYSFVMVAVSAAKGTVVKIFKECDASLKDVAEKFYSILFNSLKNTPLKPLETDSKRQERQAAKEVSGVYIGEKKYKIEKILKDEKDFYCFGDEIFGDKLQENGLLFAKGISGWLIILMFLLFISAIRRRKGIEEIIKDIKDIKIIRGKEISV